MGNKNFIMKKEDKINMLLASLAQIIADYDNQMSLSYLPSVVFLSATEVQTIEQDGNVPTNRVYTDDPLRKLLKSVVDTYYNDEERDWSEWWSTDNPQIDYSDINEVYDSAYRPEHMYHKLRILKMLISNSEID